MMRKRRRKEKRKKTKNGKMEGGRIDERRMMCSQSSWKSCVCRVGVQHYL